MNDDYLWDRSGDPDPEIERLERALVNYRYQAKPVSPALNSHLSARRTGWIRLAAVAAAILIVLAGLWIFRVQNKGVANRDSVADKGGQSEKQDKKHEALANNNRKPDRQDNQQERVTARKDVVVLPRVASAPKAPRRVPKSSAETVTNDRSFGDSDLAAERLPMNPFVDIETARHIERAQLLLRSFRNTRDSGSQPDPEVSYDKQRSRGLLYKNILLRRDAEAKGNMPVEELLGSLEPFLLDIANLSDKPSNNDVRSIKERMQKKEIVSALQVYSAPTLSQVF